MPTFYELYLINLITNFKMIFKKFTLGAKYILLRVMRDVQGTIATAPMLHH